MFIILFSAFFKFHCFFLAHCHTAGGDLSFPPRNPTSGPLQWKQRVLITGLLNSHSVFFFPPLTYNCFTMLCYFLLQTTVNQPYIYTDIPSLVRLPPTIPFTVFFLSFINFVREFCGGPGVRTPHLHCLGLIPGWGTKISQASHSQERKKERKKSLRSLMDKHQETFQKEINFYVIYIILGFPGGSNGKESTCNAGDLGLIPRLGRSPGGEHGKEVHSSILAWRIPMDRGAWRATVHGVTKSRTQLSD